LFISTLTCGFEYYIIIHNKIFKLNKSIRKNNEIGKNLPTSDTGLLKEVRYLLYDYTNAATFPNKP
jgi:hypothetical protein